MNTATTGKAGEGRWGVRLRARSQPGWADGADLDVPDRQGKRAVRSCTFERRGPLSALKLPRMLAARAGDAQQQFLATLGLADRATVQHDAQQGGHLGRNGLGESGEDFTALLVEAG